MSKPTSLELFQITNKDKEKGGPQFDSSIGAQTRYNRTEGVSWLSPNQKNVNPKDGKRARTRKRVQESWMRRVLGEGDFGEL
ncbi:hypothetical protein H5410_056073 [Solanum commersonii]|uniref:Uncharacterized protein n=1 Tax=Solanum commersonii TaxID=4109 RepID=A0A9J5WJA1_SOLCO|nr:hypothetical protein H5410_056073 [Solanum commersonii]